MELSRSEERRIAVQKGELLTESEIKEKLVNLLVENEKKFDIMASYKRYAVMYNYKTIPELIRILQRAGVGPAEINKIMEGV